MKKIQLILFITILIIPNIIMFGGFEKNLPNLENRKLKQLSDIDIKKPIQAIKDFKTFYNDNFGYKRTVFNYYSYLKNNILNENPLPQKVVIGKNNWFFLGNSAHNVFNNSINKHITKKDFVAINKNISQIVSEISAQKTPLYIFIAPNKHRVYSDELPFEQKNKKGKYDSLLNYWSKHTNLIFPLKEIKKASRTKQTYHKTDSHWNDYGAFIGFKQLIKKNKINFNNIDTLSINNYDFLDETVSKMGLTSMINKKVIENKIVLKPKKTTTSYQQNFKLGRHYKNNSKPYKVLIFRDSFSLAMIQYYRETFGECFFIKSHTPKIDIIKQIKPDLIIWQMVERNLNILSQIKL